MCQEIFDVALRGVGGTSCTEKINRGYCIVGTSEQKQAKRRPQKETGECSKNVHTPQSKTTCSFTPRPRHSPQQQQVEQLLAPPGYLRHAPPPKPGSGIGSSTLDLTHVLNAAIRSKVGIDSSTEATRNACDWWCLPSDSNVSWSRVARQVSTGKIQSALLLETKTQSYTFSIQTSADESATPRHHAHVARRRRARQSFSPPFSPAIDTLIPPVR